MKHTWTMDTVNRGRSGHEAHVWLRAKQQELEKKTGVAWSWEPAHGQCVFHPYMRKEDSNWCDNDVAEMIVNYLRPYARKLDCYRSLLDISEAINVPLPEVCGTAWELMKEQYVKATVDRMGKPHAIALRIDG